MGSLDQQRVGVIEAGERISRRNACSRSVPLSHRQRGEAGRDVLGLGLWEISLATSPALQILEFPAFLSIILSGLKIQWHQLQWHQLHCLSQCFKYTEEDALGFCSVAFSFQTPGLALLDLLRFFH